jgi:hypothetical protein
MRTPPARIRRRDSREQALENADGARFGVDSHAVRVVPTVVRVVSTVAVARAASTVVRAVSTSASELAVNRSVNAVASPLP